MRDCTPIVKTPPCIKPLTPDSRYIVMSDCHRGDGSLADEFARNSLVYKSALEYYLREGFTYVELGDAEDLWESDSFEQIYITHTSVYDLLRRFHDPDPARTRYLKVWGNHDEEWRDNPAPLRALFPDIQLHEAILLAQTNGGQVLNSAKRQSGVGAPQFSVFGESVAVPPFPGHREKQSGEAIPSILLLHVHQADPVCSGFGAKISRFLVRNVWSGLQRFGIGDPTRAAENPGRCDEIDKTLYRMAKGKIGTESFSSGGKKVSVPIFPSSGGKKEVGGHKPISPEIGIVSPYFPQGNSQDAPVSPKIVIAGHTHRPVFANLSLTERRFLESGVGTPGVRRKEKADPVYYNAGSCVHPRCITGIEITPHISLVKWGYAAAEGVSDPPYPLAIARTVLE